MKWNDEAKLELLMLLPWRISSDPSEDEGEVVLRVPEIPAYRGSGLRRR